MTTLHEAAQQALEALYQAREHVTVHTDGTWQQVENDCHAAIAALRAALAQEQAEPVLQTCNCRWDGNVQVQQCTLHEAHVDAIHEWAERAKTAEKKLAAPPRCPNCASLEAQNNELDRKLAELEREPQTLDDAMYMAQAYERGYKAGQAHERERIIQFLREMQRVVGDAHNHYGIAAVRIKEGV